MGKKGFKVCGCIRSERSLGFRRTPKEVRSSSTVGVEAKLAPPGDSDDGAACTGAAVFVCSFFGRVRGKAARAGAKGSLWSPVGA